MESRMATRLMGGLEISAGTIEESENGINPGALCCSARQGGDCHAPPFLPDSVGPVPGYRVRMGRCAHCHWPGRDLGLCRALADRHPVSGYSLQQEVRSQVPV